MILKKSCKKGQAAALLLGVLVISGAVAKKGLEKFFGPGADIFIIQLLKHPTEVGALVPCSTFVAYEITASIREQRQKNPDKPLRILEVGAGNGIFTSQILKEAPEDSHIDVIEINADFCKILQKRFGSIPSVSIYQIDILQFKPAEKYDIIISALPFNIFQDEFLSNIFNHYEALIVKGGSLSYFEYCALMNIKKIFLPSKELTLLEKKLSIISNFREKYLKKSVKVLANVPPVYVHHLDF